MRELVWLTEERTWAHLRARGAYFSIVYYTRGGIDFEVLIENDEYFFGEDDSDDEAE